MLHAAGTNETADVSRMANLLQVSSAFGRAMESVDRDRVSAAVYPSLRRLQDEAGWGSRHSAHAIAASAEGYAFPTNLDRAQPVGGLAPESQAQLMHRALEGRWGAEALCGEIAVRAGQQLTH